MFLCQTKNGVKTFVHYLSLPAGKAGAAEAIVVKRGNAALEYYFPYTDHLGSIVGVTNVGGELFSEQNFDAWGRKRNPNNWTYDNIPGVISWLYRGYTGHEHLDAFGLINMNARLYDPILGRMLSPDNFVGDAGSQGFNRYSYANNNPLSFVDPDGNHPLLGYLAIAAIYGGVNLGAEAIRGNVNSVGDGLKAFGLGAAQGVLSLATGGTTNAWGAFASAVSSQLPEIPIPISDNFSLSLNPAFIMGSTGFGAGANISLNAKFGEFSFSVGIGSTYYSKHAISGKSGFENRFTGAAGYDNGIVGLTFASTHFSGLGFDQRIGYGKIRYKDWSFSYENDGSPYQKVGLGGGTDSYRTAAASLGYQDYEIGMRLFTGRREYGNHCYDKNEIYGEYGYVGNPDINDYRAGILTIGYKGYSVGINDDRVRQVFQNTVAHSWIQPQTKIPNMTLSKFFLERRSKNFFTNW